MKKKLTIVVSLFLVLALSIGGTIAWLTDTDSVTNTFTIGKVDITLTEPAGAAVEYDYSIVPGAVYAKDPTITVTTDSEDCWLFVKIEDKNNTNDAGAKYITYEVRTGEGNWTQLTTDKAGNDITAQQIYYRKVAKDAETKTFYVLTEGTPTDTTTSGKNGVVTANGATITSEYVAKLADKDSGVKAPELVFTAYAIQQQSFTSAADAWAELNP